MILPNEDPLLGFEMGNVALGSQAGVGAAVDPTGMTGTFLESQQELAGQGRYRPAARQAFYEWLEMMKSATAEEPQSKSEKVLSNLADLWFRQRAINQPGDPQAKAWFGLQDRRARIEQDKRDEAMSLYKNLLDMELRAAETDLKWERFDQERRANEDVDLGAHLGVPDFKGTVVKRGVADSLHEIMLKNRVDGLVPDPMAAFKERKASADALKAEAEYRSMVDPNAPLSARDAADLAWRKERVETENLRGEALQARITQMAKEPSTGRPAGQMTESPLIRAAAEIREAMRQAKGSETGDSSLDPESDYTLAPPDPAGRTARERAWHWVKNSDITPGSALERSIDQWVYSVLSGRRESLRSSGAMTPAAPSTPPFVPRGGLPSRPARP